VTTRLRSDEQCAFGQRLRAARKMRGISGSQLGRLLDPPITYAAVSDMERGITRVRLDRVQELAAVLAVTPAQLLGFGAMTPIDVPTGPRWTLEDRVTVLEAEVTALRAILRGVRADPSCLGAVRAAGAGR
jgi:transcriptional regulator with XRE-family HTH domain